ncbi:hypothetical protein [Tessaracoccus terricola]
MSTVPVLDARVLGRLGDDLGDPVLLCTFVDRYADLLQTRIARVEHALAAHDLEDWHDAALSLRTSSTMAGAAALAELVSELQQTVEENPLADVVWLCNDKLSAAILDLKVLAEETNARLRAFVASVTERTSRGQSPWSPA